MRGIVQIGIAATGLAAGLALAAPGAAGPVSLLPDDGLAMRAPLSGSGPIGVPVPVRAAPARAPQDAADDGTAAAPGTAPRPGPDAADRDAGALFAASLVALLAQPDGGGGDGATAGLFADRAARGAFFAPGGPLWGDGARPSAQAPRAGATGPTARLLDLIARAEAGRAGYDAVQHGARIPPPKPPTALTLAEIEAWTVATPRQPHAIGRYQFIPPTLRRLVEAEGLPPDTRFSPAVQDRLADRLLAEAGIRAFKRGELTRTRFMRNLARIWAGLPLPDGRSYYDGYAGNKATISWDEFDTAMQAIFPGGAGDG